MLVDTIQEEITVQSGSQTFIEMNGETGKLEITDALNFSRAFSDDALEDISAVPSWLRPALEEKLVYAGVKGHEIADTFHAFGDLDGDNDLDMISYEYPEYHFYKNVGTPALSLFKMDDTIGSLEELNRMELDMPITLGDADGDGDNDLVAGYYSTYYYFENTGTARTPIFSLISETATSSGLNSPCLSDMTDDGLSDLILGKENGRCELWINADSENETEFFQNSLAMTIVDVGNDASPTAGDMDGDGDLDLVIGSDSAILHYYENMGSETSPLFTSDNLAIFADIRAGTRLRPHLVPLDTDGLNDLVLSSSQDRTYFFDNLGSSYNPLFKISSSYELWSGMYYYPPNRLLRIMDESVVQPYLDLISSAPAHLVDEIAYSISYTSDDVLLNGQVLPEMYLDNAEYVYYADERLDYVDLVEIEDMNMGGPYTTAVYRVTENEMLREITMPRDIYYRFIVHPKVTEETPTFIDPDTGGFSQPVSNGGNGRFWREYFLNHADDSYPSDPDPDDGLDQYPENATPPLLLELLEGVETLFNRTTFHAPADRDPYYGDHAVIRISNWVGKTLILNQQEVSDDERPIQPVRIARSHNGNCGELQDLTVAAARAALVPAAGAIMMAEDHVWIEFWEDEWHQWDNYWSDSGSIIDNWDNYWYGWGGRGGSGIYKWYSNDMIGDVTPQYVPSEVLSDVNVLVTDRNGEPVDGARVVIGSHWLMEHSTDSDITAPFPSIWNYTDSDGFARFRLTSNNISIKVISRLGNGAVTKTFIDPGTVYHFEVSLEGAKNRPLMRVMEIPDPEDDDWKIEYDLEVVGAYQRPPNADTGSVHSHPIYSANHMDFSILPQNEFHSFRRTGIWASGFRPISDTVDYTGDIQVGTDRNVYFLLHNCDQMETFKKVKVNLSVYKRMDNKPFVTIEEPIGGAIYLTDEDIRVSGAALDREGIETLELSVDNVGRDITLYLDNGSYVYTLEAGEIEVGNHSLKVKARNTRGYISSMETWFHVSDLVPPEVTFSAPLEGESYLIPEELLIKGRVEGHSMEYLELFVQGPEVNEEKDITPSLNGNNFDYGLKTDAYPEGEYEITVKAVDELNQVGAASVIINFVKEHDVLAPNLVINNPVPGTDYYTDEYIVLNGTAIDNVEIVTLTLIVDQDEPIEITHRIMEEGEFSQYLDTSDLVLGRHTVSLIAEDSEGNRALADTYFYLKERPELPPLPPNILIERPSEGEVFELGEQVVLEAEIFSELEIIVLRYSIDGGATWTDGMSQYSQLSGSFDVTVDSEKLEVGLNQFLIELVDIQEQEADGWVYVEIIDTTAPDVRWKTSVGGSVYTLEDSLSLSVSVEDLTRIKRVELIMEGEGLLRSFDMERGNDNSTYIIDLELIQFFQGEYSIKAEAEDWEGNVGTVTEQLLIKDISGGDREEKGGVPGILIALGIILGLFIVLVVVVLVSRER